jgi:hypothetical protein
MFYAELGVPHFHAVYGEPKVSIGIEDRVVLEGMLQPRALRLALRMVSAARGRMAGELAPRPSRRAAGTHCPAGVACMDYDVVEARCQRAHALWLRFRDGTCGEIDLAPALHGPIMAPLKDPAYFREFRIHPEFNTFVWPNGADFAPEFLHDKIRVQV